MDTAVKSETECCIGEDLPEKLKTLLPDGYDYHVCEFDEPGEGDSNIINFKTVIRLRATNGEEVRKWISDFQASSFSTWRVLQTYALAGRKVNFKKKYRCHHNTRPEKGANQKRKTPSKHTGCPANMSISVKNIITENGKFCRHKTDKHLPIFPTTVTLNFNHNHKLAHADALRHRDVLDETRDKLLYLFRNDCRPADALRELREALQEEHGENFEAVVKDRALCPDLGYCWRLYRESIEKSSDSMKTGDELLQSLEKIAEQCKYDESVDLPPIKTTLTNENKIAVAICTPLMQRVHALVKESGDLAYILMERPSKEVKDRESCYVFLILTYSCVGSLPLGILITTSKGKRTVTAALELYKSMVPEDCFAGRGVVGPQLFVIQDCQTVRKALGKVFPQSSLVLSVGHVLQATWRWLWYGEDDIPREARPGQLSHMERMLYETTCESEVQSSYVDSMADPSLYHSFKEYLTKFYERRHEWAVTHLSSLPIRGSESNIYEAMRVLKSEYLDQPKPFDPADLTEYVLNHFQDYLQRRILDLANGHTEYIFPGTQTKGFYKSDITQITAHDFSMKMKKSGVEHAINTRVGHCTCVAGRTGGPCKHQAVVEKYFKKAWRLNPITDENVRGLLFKVATGCEVPVNDEQGQPEPHPGKTVVVEIPARLVPDGQMTEEIRTAIDVLCQQAAAEQAAAEEEAAIKAAAQQAAVQQAATQHKQHKKLGNALAKSTDGTDDDLERRLECMYHDLRMKLSVVPKLFRPAVLSMLDQYDNMVNDVDLASALHTFRKDSSAIGILKKSLKRSKGSRSSTCKDGRDADPEPRKKKKKKTKKRAHLNKESDVVDNNNDYLINQSELGAVVTLPMENGVGDFVAVPNQDYTTAHMEIENQHELTAAEVEIVTSAVNA